MRKKLEEFLIDEIKYLEEKQKKFYRCSEDRSPNCCERNLWEFAEYLKRKYVGYLKEIREEENNKVSDGLKKLRELAPNIVS